MQYNPLEDGKTHLNLYSKAKTELGMFSSNFSYSPIETEDGHFDSIEGYWGWLGISEGNPRREEFRTLSGYEAKKLKDDLFKAGDPGRFEPDFKRKIRDAIHLKFQTKEAITIMTKYKEMLSLPLCHYYTFQNGEKTQIMDVTKDYPEFVNSVKEEFQSFLAKNGAMFGVCKGIICQQVNCQGVMGAGLAKAIMDIHPEVYDSYMKKSRLFQKETLFGQVDMIPIGEDFYVANIYSQFDYGNPQKTGKIYTDAVKLRNAVRAICIKYSHLPVYLPHTTNLEGKKEYGIGCGYGGESWSKLAKMFRDIGKENLHLLDTNTGTVHELEAEESLSVTKYPLCKGMSKIGEKMETYQAEISAKYGYEPLKGKVKNDALEKYLLNLPPCFVGDMKTLDTGYELQGKEQPLYLKDGTKIASGYERIVVGHYGAFIEIDEEHIIKDKMEVRKGEEYRYSPKFVDKVKYFWLTVGDTEAKIYEQQKGVTYADYKPGKYYISPYEVKDKSEVLAMNEKWNDSFLKWKSEIPQKSLDINPSLYEEKAIIFDLETTGFSAANGDEPLQISIVNEDEEVILSTYLKPRYKKQWKDSEKVHHITPAMVENCFHMDEIADVLKLIFEKAKAIVGHNVSFDISFIEKYGKFAVDKNKVFDTCKYFKKDMPILKHRLENAVMYYCPEAYREYAGGAHDALVDTIATARVYNAIQEREKELDDRA